MKTFFISFAAPMPNNQIFFGDGKVVRETLESADDVEEVRAEITKFHQAISPVTVFFWKELVDPKNLH